jgi:hypothetical protein
MYSQMGGALAVDNLPRRLQDILIYHVVENVVEKLVCPRLVSWQLSPLDYDTERVPCSEHVPCSSDAEER